MSTSTKDAITKPTDMTASPPATTSFDPQRCMATMASGEVTPVAIAKGRVRRPASSGE